MKHSPKEYVLVTRPWSFPASAMPVIVSLAWLFARHQSVNPWIGLWTLLTIIIVHAAGNVWSDYFDFKSGVDRDDTYGVKILTSGQFQPKEIMRISIVLQLAALVSGIALVCATGSTLLWIGVAGILLSLCYPPLKYMALGDVVIYLCYAFLPMTGVTFICTGAIQWDVLWLSAPVGLITIAILHANNTRDIETDRRAGISTLAMMMGQTTSAVLYCAEVLIPFFWMLLLAVLGIVSWWTSLVWLVFPLSMKNVRTMMSYRQGGVAAFARLDEASAQLQLAFSLLLSVGLLLSHYLG